MIGDIRTVADLHAALSTLPDEALLLTDSYQGGLTTIAAVVETQVQELSRDEDQSKSLGPFELFDEARRQAAMSPDDPEIAIGGVRPPRLVGEPVHAVILRRKGR